MKLLAIFGTRPEAIKLAPVIKAAQQDPRFKMKICVTAQHREMLDPFLALFSLKPDYDLNVMSKGQDLFDVTTRVLLGLKDVLAIEKPDYVLVQGDTTTTFVGALAAFYHQIPVGHVEAGLRTGNLAAPFPEEANRKLTTQLATHHFAPTKWAAKNLMQESVSEYRIIVTGNTVIDALLWVRDKIKHKKVLDHPEIFNSKQPIILITGHRRENFGEGFEQICQALATLAKKHTDWQFTYPVHLNPNVQKPVRSILSGYKNIHLMEPLSYEQFVFLMDRSKLILTDSGGIQEEAPALGKPVLVMRDTTERPEAIEAGTALLVGTSAKRIIAAVEELMMYQDRYQQMAKAKNPFGDGHTAPRILNKILDLKDKPCHLKSEKLPLSV